MASWHMVFMFALVLVHATARNIPKVQTHDDKNVNTETLSTSTAPTPSNGGLNDEKNFIAFGGVGGCSGIGSYGGVFPTLGGAGGGVGGGVSGGLGGAGFKGIGVGGGIGGYKGVGVTIP
ncbi:unnamed protein product [Withania somnifera]